MPNAGARGTGMACVDSVRKTTSKTRRRERWDKGRGERKSSGAGGTKGQSTGMRQVMLGRSRAQTTSQVLLENANFILLAMGEQKFKIFMKAREKLRLAHLKVPSVQRQA